MLTRRQFLKAAAGMTLGLVVFRAAAPLDREETLPLVGPKVYEGLDFLREDGVVQARCGGEPVLVMNESGYSLVRLADGTRSLDEIIRVNRANAEPEEVADFFLTLGQSGWLENRVEVTKYAVES